jgi:uncharacterized protein DUF7009
VKLRIHGNSLRLRLSRSETARLVQAGRIEETIRFAPGKEATLTYALEHSIDHKAMSVRWRPQEVTVILPAEEAREWVEGDQVGMCCNCAVGEEMLALLVEKDFACLEGTDADNEDTFPNPNRGAIC